MLCDSKRSIEKKDILSSINKFMIKETNNKSNQNIEYIIKTPKKSVIPRSERQKNYVSALKESDVTISTGPAGTGKTFLAVFLFQSPDFVFNFFNSSTSFFISFLNTFLSF